MEAYDDRGLAYGLHHTYKAHNDHQHESMNSVVLSSEHFFAVQSQWPDYVHIAAREELETDHYQFSDFTPSSTQTSQPSAGLYANSLCENQHGAYAPNPSISAPESLFSLRQVEGTQGIPYSEDWPEGPSGDKVGENRGQSDSAFSQGWEQADVGQSQPLRSLEGAYLPPGPSSPLANVTNKAIARDPPDHSQHSAGTPLTQDSFVPTNSYIQDDTETSKERVYSPSSSRRTSTTSVTEASSPGGSERSRLACRNCTTQVTPLWRRDSEGDPLCNACGLFLKLHGVMRPMSLRTDVIKKRNRTCAAKSTGNKATRTKKAHHRKA